MPSRARRVATRFPPRPSPRSRGKSRLRTSRLATPRLPLPVSVPRSPKAPRVLQCLATVHTQTLRLVTCPHTTEQHTRHECAPPPRRAPMCPPRTQKRTVLRP
eukprot:5074611-Prymnesium_polylepis.1